MLRRFLITTLAAPTLICAAAVPAAATAPGAVVPAARNADDGDAPPAPDVPSCEEDCPVDDPAVDGEDAPGACDDWAVDGEWADAAPVPADGACVEAGEEEGEESGEEATPVVVPPRLSALGATVAGLGGRQRVRVTFHLDRAAVVRLTLERTATAVARGARRTRRPVALHGSVAVDGRSGGNATPLPKRWSGRRLVPGTYRLTATPEEDAAHSAVARFTLAPAAGASKLHRGGPRSAAPPPRRAR
jgi:hypothetical protein